MPLSEPGWSGLRDEQDCHAQILKFSQSRPSWFRRNGMVGTGRNSRKCFWVNMKDVSFCFNFILEG